MLDVENTISSEIQVAQAYIKHLRHVNVRVLMKRTDGQMHHTPEIVLSANVPAVLIKKGNKEM